MTIFQSWEEIGRIVATSVLIYAAVVLFIRLMDKRSTSKMNNFDWVITVALGSITGSVILFKDVVLVDGLIAVFALLFLQYLTRLSLLSQTFMRAVHVRPTLIFYKGRFLKNQMKKERVLEQEVLSAIRSQGYTNLDYVTAVILESNADLSIIGNTDQLSARLLNEVTGVPAQAN